LAEEGIRYVADEGIGYVVVFEWWSYDAPVWSCSNFNSLRTGPFAARSCGLFRFYSAHVTALPRTSPRHVRVVKSTNFTESTGPRAGVGPFYLPDRESIVIVKKN